MEPMRYDELRGAGVSRRAIDRAVASGALDRVWRGVYGSADDRLEQLSALLKRLPADAAFGLHTAAELHGFGTGRRRDIHVMVPAGRPHPRIRGVRAHEAVLPLAPPTVVLGLPCTPALRTAVDLARSVRRMDALPILDAALRVTGFPPDALHGEVARHAGLRGIRQARELATLADARSECRQESQLRLVVIDGGLPAPEPQVPVYDRAGFGVYRLDLAYRAARVGLEYDGQSHLDRVRLRADRARMNWLEAHAWRMRYFTDQDLYGSPALIVATVRATLAPR
ncbi:MAG TPA: type IV toxin-antitoxin system AbiEi family antitoxin domain-containing protein [Micromonosporaceae bacterium]|nr:type IV toxin-antitoxin system AbiEi family antitoxin domain-containing protein [Micromonosporaceae bacterium]